MFSAVHGFTQCWSCKGPCQLSDILCPCCGVITCPSPHISLYEVMHVDPHPTYSPADVAAVATPRQALAHPDGYAQKSEQERYHSTLWSTQLNEAYAAFMDPVATLMAYLRVTNPKMPLPALPLVTLAQIIATEEHLQRQQRSSAPAEQGHPEGLDPGLHYAHHMRLGIKAALSGDEDDAMMAATTAHYWHKLAQRYGIIMPAYDVVCDVIIEPSPHLE